MDTVTATLRLYRAVAEAAAKTFGRSIVGLSVLLIAAPTLSLASALVLGKLGIVGGFLLAIGQCAATSAYLGLVGRALDGRRLLGPRDAFEALTVHLWDVMSVLFLFWIASLLLRGNTVLSVVLLVAAVAFNPTPEIVTRGGRSTDALMDAAKFMLENWPEWLIAHLPTVGLLAGWAWLAGLPIVPSLLTLLPGFGPSFDFIEVGGLLTGWSGAPWIAVLVLIVHATMTMRAHLFRALASSSRRGRAWQSRR